jgi:hypothetical protein
MLRQKPEITGIAVPGMPMGSPGMESPRPQNYETLTFDADGNTTVWATMARMPEIHPLPNRCTKPSSAAHPTVITP